MADALVKDVNAALIAAGERPAARGESGFSLYASGSGVLVTYRAAGTGEAVWRREALGRWLGLLGEAGQAWTVTGIGSRRISAVRVTTLEASAHVPWTPRCSDCNGYCGTCEAAVRDEGGSL